MGAGEITGLEWRLGLDSKGLYFGKRSKCQPDLHWQQKLWQGREGRLKGALVGQRAEIRKWEGAPSFGGLWKVTNIFLVPLWRNLLDCVNMQEERE